MFHLEHCDLASTLSIATSYLYLRCLALQCAHDLPHARQGARPRGAFPTPCLRDGDHRSVDHRGDVAGHHVGSLLAGDALELALTQPHDPLLVVILGPTASGKTALSLALAQHFHGEIVNCDSVAMYREFEIGTAKPSRAGARLRSASSLRRDRTHCVRHCRGICSASSKSTG